MIKNYLTTALRFLKRNKLFAGINILGLSLALAASFIILLYVINELSYNTCFKNRKQIYRVINYYENFKRTTTQTPYILGETMREEFTQVKNAASAIHFGDIKIKKGQDFISVDNAVSADAEIFDLFDFGLSGQQKNIFDEPNSIVLSKKQVQKFFPDNDPVGQEVVVLIGEQEEVFVIRGVFDDIPVNSTFRAECFVGPVWGIKLLNKRDESWSVETDWQLNFWETWLLLNPNADIISMNAQFRALEKKVFGEKDDSNFLLQNLPDVYLHSQDIDWSRIKGNPENIQIFLAIAILVTLVASFNYIILSTAVSTGRAQEIGIRKTNGASSQSIRKQLLNESVILAFLVFPLALFLAWLVRPYAEELFQTQLIILKSNIAIYVAIYIALTLIIGLASGFYTSSFLSKLNVINILKNATYNGKRKTRIRTALIVVQLVIFCCLVSGTLIIRSQYKFALEEDKGYESRDILFVNVGLNAPGTKAFMNSISDYPNVISVGGTFETFPVYGGMPTYFQNLLEETKQVPGQMLPVSSEFIETMGLTVLEGQNFSWKPKDDEEVAFYVNETAVKELGITDPIGFVTDPLGQHMIGGRIVGVVKDFNLYTIHKEIPPVFLAVFDNYVQQVVVRYQSGSLDHLLPLLREEWEKIAEGQPFEYKTVEQFNEEAYTAEKKLGTIVSIFALFSLFIAAIGLFGVTLFIMKSQTKEIGIRKVCGSSGKEIVMSFVSTNFVMVILATLLSVPPTFLVMNRWLSNFSFHTGIKWWIFVLAFVVATFVVLLTVLYHSFRASRINPVEALRYE